MHGDDTIEDIFFSTVISLFPLWGTCKAPFSDAVESIKRFQLAWKRLQPRPTQDINANLDTTLKLTTTLSLQLPTYISP